MENDYDLDEILSEIDSDDFNGSISGYPDNNTYSEKENDLPDEMPESESDTFSISVEKTEERAMGSSEEVEVETDEVISENFGEPESTVEDLSDKVRFTVKGTKFWNTREPYIIKIEPEKLGKDMSLLAKSFYFIRDKTERDKIEHTVKLKFARFMRNTSRNVISDYEEFIFKLIISETDKMLTRFKIDREKSKLFIYHIGPLTLYRIVLKKFDLDNIGSCYRFSPEKGSVFSFIPEEYIKTVILKWYEININTLKLPFDNETELDAIIKSITKIYNASKRQFLIRLNELNRKLPPGKSIESHRLLELKGNQWFGYSNIIIFKRFLKKTIFR